MNVASNSLVRTVLPLVTWKLQKACGPVFERSEWKAIALSFVPPPKNLINVITREFTGVDCLALLSASHRRRVRNRGKRLLKRHFLNNPMTASAVQEHLLHLRQEMEAAGNGSDPARIRKLRDLEAETNECFQQLLQSDEPPEELNSILKGTPDAANLLWEFALHGEGGNKPKLRRNSEIWEALRLDPEQLESVPPDEGLILCLSRFEALLGLDSRTPDESGLLRVAQWVVRTHLPPEREPETTSEALRKAVEVGLIHKGIVIRDKETGEVADVDVEDTNATQLNGLSQTEGREAIIQAMAHKGIAYDDLTPREWAEVFERYDLLRKGYEFSSKTGVSISSFYGADAHAKEQKWSRLKKTICKVLKNRQ